MTEFIICYEVELHFSTCCSYKLKTHMNMSKTTKSRVSVCSQVFTDHTLSMVYTPLLSEPARH